MRNLPRLRLDWVNPLPLIEEVLSYALHPLARLGRLRNYITSIHPGERALPESGKVVVFLHYDRHGVVHDFVLHYLDSLRDAGFEILFVTNGPALKQPALDRVRLRCATVLCRRNVGYDFGGYRDGLQFLGDLSRFEQVLLANDSVYGPIFDLKATLEQCDGRAAVWSMTDSWSKRFHLQSYFLLFRREALTAPRFQRFWQPLPLPHSKWWIIRHYEIGFTQAMLRAGLPCAALFPYRTAVRDLTRAGNAGVLSDESLNPRVREFLAMLSRGVERGTPFNALHYFWDHMILHLRCPFIKRELLAKNPANIPHAYLWEKLIQGVSGYDTELIARHLELTARNHAP